MGRRIVIIGAGVVGVALADELTERGETDVLVVDKGPLWATGGSTSHAPGLVSRTSPSKMMQLLADHTIAKFASLDLEGAPCLLPVGTLEVALTEERLTELRRRQAFTTSWGWKGELIAPEAAVERWPILDGTLLVGAYATADEGLAVAMRAVEAQARRAIGRGARFEGGTTVTGIAHRDGRATGVVTGSGEIPADVVVCCAGVWGPAIARSVGLTLPMVAFEHQYVVTSPVAALAANAEREATMPIVRHHDAGVYVRDHGDRVGIGSFAHRRLPVAIDDLDRHERREDGLSYAFTPEDFTEPWERTCELFPALRETTFERAFNGVFAFTPDGYPLVGEHPDLDGLWVGESVWVTHSAGVARVIAEVLTGQPPWIDASPADLTRFEQVELATAVIEARCDDSYRDVYEVHHPSEGHSSARDLRFSPFEPRQRALGAAWFDAGGWERPRWFEANAPLVPDLGGLPERDAWASRFWSPIEGAEHVAVRERAGLVDLTPLTRIEIAGPGAQAFLLAMTAGRVDRPVGTVTYTVMLDASGGIRSDVTVARLTPDRFLIGANGPRDVAWLRVAARRRGDAVTVREVTAGTSVLGLWGPAAPAILASVSDADLSQRGFPYLSVRELWVGEVPAVATRISYAGETGWELLATADLGLRLWDVLWGAGQERGLTAVGRAAFGTLRLEKGYRAWSADLSPEFGPDESGLGFTVREGDGFRGAEGLARRRDEGPAPRRLVTLAFEGQQPPTGGEPVLVGGDPVGYVTSAGYGWTVGHAVGLAWVAEALSPGDAVEVSYLGARLLARIAPDVLVDPAGDRLRASTPH